jgi:NAD(P)-dependent dehydrogenase (short-subunit alcohol dehydrogenase family)
VDGHEQAFGVCHLGHFLFTMLVWDLVLKADGGHARVVPVGSVAHEWTSMKTGEELLDDPKFEKGTWGPQENYARAKLANVLFAKELARRVGTFGQSAEQLSRPGDSRDAVKVTVVTNSPGYAASSLYKEMNVNCGAKLLISMMATHPDNLSINTMRAATDLGLSSGCYLSPKRMNFWGPPVVKDSSRLSQSESLAKRL